MRRRPLGASADNSSRNAPFSSNSSARLVAAHPVFQQPQVLGILAYFAERHLVRAPRVLYGLAIHKLRSCPALGRAHDQHRPRWARRRTLFARSFLNGCDAIQHGLKYRRGLLVQNHRIVTLKRERLVSITAHQFFEFGVRNPRQHGRIGDLIAIQVKDGQHRAVGCRVEKLVRVPACGQRACLRFTIAHHAGHDQVRIVECRAIRVHQRVSQLAALVDGSRRLGCHVARNSIRPAELAKQALDAVLVLLDVRINLGVGALKVRICNQTRSAMTRADDVHHVEVALTDQAVPMHVEEVKPRRCAPVAEQSRLIDG